MHALAVPLRRLEDLILGPRPPGWLNDAIDPLVELLDHPVLPAVSEPFEDDLVARSVRGAATSVVAKEGTWPLVMFRVPPLGFQHGSGLVERWLLVYVWLEGRGRGLVMLTDPDSWECHMVSIRMSLLRLGDPS